MSEYMDGLRPTITETPNEFDARREQQRLADLIDDLYSWVRATNGRPESQTLTDAEAVIRQYQTYSARKRAAWLEERR